MKKSLISATLAISATIALTAQADSFVTNWGTISKIENYGDDTHVAGLDLSPNPGGCASTSWAKVEYSLSAAKKEGLTRMLTSAFLAGRQVKVKLRSGKCEGDHPAIYGVQVQ